MVGKTRVVLFYSKIYFQLVFDPKLIVNTQGNMLNRSMASKHKKTSLKPKFFRAQIYIFRYFQDKKNIISTLLVI